MEAKYHALRIVGAIYKVMAIIVGIMAILMALLMCIGATSIGAALDTVFARFGYSIGGMGTGLMAVIGIACAVIILARLLSFAVGLFAAGERIFLLIDLEENTRWTALLLERLVTGGSRAAPITTR